MIFNTEGGTIRQFLRYPIIINEADAEDNSGTIALNQFIYLSLWYLFTITTYGVWVPSGLFLPGILIGCSIGILYLELMLAGFGLSIERIGG